MTSSEIEQCRHLGRQLCDRNIVPLEFNAGILTVANQFDEISSIHLPKPSESVLVPALLESVLAAFEQVFNECSNERIVDRTHVLWKDAGSPIVNGRR